MIKKEIPRISSASTGGARLLAPRRAAAPIIISEATSTWPAMGKWSFDFFQRNFGRIVVRAGAPQFRQDDAETRFCCVQMFLWDYIEYLKDPSQNPRALWLSGSPELLSEMKIPLYAGNFNPFREKGGRELLLPHVSKATDWAEDWSEYLPNFLRERLWKAHSHFYVYLSAKGSFTPLHVDFWCTHAYLAQIQGIKKCMLFPPGEAALVYYGAVNPFLVDEKMHPSAAEATAWVGTIEPGDVLMIPAGWWHSVVTCSDSITYSYDWFDRRNCHLYLLEAFKDIAAEWLYLLRRRRNVF